MKKPIEPEIEDDKEKIWIIFTRDPDVMKTIVGGSIEYQDN